ncbi:hypothetical protein ACFLVW_07895 [Chloroflexota bacterium]
MVDWEIVAKVAGGGYGVTILVLMILSLVTWILGLVIQRIQVKGKEIPAKEK